MTESKKSHSVIKILLIFFIVFILVPLGIITLVYFNNDNFKNKANNTMKNAPGIIGKYFNKFPTEKEREEKKNFLANYYISLDKDSAADKLYIVKKNDEVLYNDIIKYMSNISPSKTEEIITMIRNIELRKDLVFSLYDEIQNEKKVMWEQQIKEIEQMDKYMAIQKIKNMLANNKNNYNQIADIFTYIDENRAVEILYYLDENLRNNILSLIENDKKMNLEHLLAEKTLQYNEFKELAKSYEVEDSEKLFSEIGNTDKYSIEELAKIYMNLSIKKASEALVNVQDEQFIEDLFEEIRREERLIGTNQESVTVNIRKTINFLKDYEEKIKDLVTVFEKMNTEETAKIVDKMLLNDSNISVFKIDSSSQYEITDASVAIDVLKRMKKTTLSDILSNLDTRRAAEISRKLIIQ